MTPSVVYFPPPPAAPIVGHPARRLQALHPSSTVHSVKRFIGRRGQELAEEELTVTYPLRGKGWEPLTIDIQGRSYVPEQVSAEVLKKLRHDAEASLGETITRDGFAYTDLLPVEKGN